MKHFGLRFDVLLLLSAVFVKLHLSNLRSLPLFGSVVKSRQRLFSSNFFRMFLFHVWQPRTSVVAPSTTSSSAPTMKRRQQLFSSDAGNRRLSIENLVCIGTLSQPLTPCSCTNGFFCTRRCCSRERDVWLTHRATSSQQPILRAQAIH